MYHHLPTVGPSQCCCWEATTRAVEEAIQVNKVDGWTRDGHTVYTQGIPRGHMDDVTTSITAYQEDRAAWSCQSVMYCPHPMHCRIVLSLTFTTHKHIIMDGKISILYVCRACASIFRDMCMSCVHTLSSCYSSDKVTVIQVQLPLPLCLTEPVTSHLWPLHWVVIRRGIEWALHTPHSTDNCLRDKTLSCI